MRPWSRARLRRNRITTSGSWISSLPKEDAPSSSTVRNGETLELREWPQGFHFFRSIHLYFKPFHSLSSSKTLLVNRCSYGGKNESASASASMNVRWSLSIIGRACLYNSAPPPI